MTALAQSVALSPSSERSLVDDPAPLLFAPGPSQPTARVRVPVFAPSVNATHWAGGALELRGLRRG
ncbi:MAG: hypothetical protein QOJ31_161 [Gaiellales bacterium]|nr:hypothetical protein [Gaiellales bacterium]